MRRSLNDTSDILRKRKPNSSLLDLWKLNKRQRKERIFEHPLITGKLVLVFKVLLTSNLRRALK